MTDLEILHLLKTLNKNPKDKLQEDKLRRCIRIFKIEELNNVNRLTYNLDHIIEWVDDRKLDNICGRTNKEAWEDYQKFCKEHDYSDKMERLSFHKALLNYYNLETIVRKIDGKSVRVIVSKI